MRRTEQLQGPRMLKMRDVLSRWQARVTVTVHLIGCSSARVTVRVTVTVHLIGCSSVY
jgi:hypothetical protein